jgi:hypothetical protein
MMLGQAAQRPIVAGMISAIGPGQAFPYCGVMSSGRFVGRLLAFILTR